MSLTEQIQRERSSIEGYENAIAEAREKLWDAHFVATHDARRKGESDEHWEKRRKRNRTAFENRDEAVAHLKRKLEAHRKLLEKLKKDKKEFQEEQAENRSDYEKGSTKIVVMDGKSIVEDLAYWLDLARKNGWNGVVVSGYRTPAYSTSLCYGMCGAPTCPGRCAGASSNHAKTTYPGPAADVTDYINCERVLQSIGAPYFNDLPLDLVHMSRSGH
jgi:hypothetical protein